MSSASMLIGKAEGITEDEVSQIVLPLSIARFAPDDLAAKHGR
jgi:hypothetical protein